MLLESKLKEVSPYAREELTWQEETKSLPDKLRYVSALMREKIGTDSQREKIKTVIEDLENEYSLNEGEESIVDRLSASLKRRMQ